MRVYLFSVNVSHYLGAHVSIVDTVGVFAQISRICFFVGGGVELRCVTNTVKRAKCIGRGGGLLRHTRAPSAMKMRTGSHVKTPPRRSNWIESCVSTKSATQRGGARRSSRLISLLSAFCAFLLCWEQLIFVTGSFLTPFLFVLFLFRFFPFVDRR